MASRAKPMGSFFIGRRPSRRLSRADDAWFAGPDGVRQVPAETNLWKALHETLAPLRASVVPPRRWSCGSRRAVPSSSGQMFSPRSVRWLHGTRSLSSEPAQEAREGIDHFRLTKRG